MTEATAAWPEGGAVGTDAQVEGPGKKRGRKPLPPGERARRRKAYWQTWWDEHKDEIAEKRARLWREDQEYRDRENARRRKQRKALRQKREAVPRPPPKPWLEYDVTVGGGTERAYTLGYVAQRLGCSEALLRLWRWRGQLPESPFRRGRVHIYTEAMVEAIVGARSSRERFRAGRWSVGADPTMGPEIRAAWDRILQKGA